MAATVDRLATRAATEQVGSGPIVQASQAAAGDLSIYIVRAGCFSGPEQLLL
jgi:hypothetical protein